jgi:carbon-monoxide dehydrogenase medium subunit
MLLSEVEYGRPTSIEDALRMLGTHDDARALAGGQTLLNVMKLRIVGPERVVDITRIPELRGVRRSDDGGLEIGATTTYAELVETADVRAVRPVIAEAAAMIADVQVRNRGTIGGNVCLNMPTNHFPPVLVAIGARLTIVGPSGARELPAADFFESTFATAVRPGELLTTIHVPPRDEGRADAFVAMSAGAESQSIVHVAVSLSWGGAIRDPRIALGCVAPAPLRATAVEHALDGLPADEAAIGRAIDGLGATLSPVGDVNASASFKRHVAEVLVRRAVMKAIRAGTEG